MKYQLLTVEEVFALAMLKVRPYLFLYSSIVITCWLLNMCDSHVSLEPGARGGRDRRPL